MVGVNQSWLVLPGAWVRKFVSTLAQLVTPLPGRDPTRD